MAIHLDLMILKLLSKDEMYGYQIVSELKKYPMNISPCKQVRFIHSYALWLLIILCKPLKRIMTAKCEPIIKLRSLAAKNLTKAHSIGFYFPKR